MPTYTCEKCARVFKQKSGYTDHMKKKIDCAAATAITPILEEIKEIKREMQSIKQYVEITKETLPGFFEDLHNLLWNRAGLSPERALEHMTFFFAYRLIEPQATRLQLPKECHWGYIASLKNENDLYDAIIRGTEHFWTCPITQPFFKPHEIKKAELIYEIVQQINRIPLAILQQTDAIGDVFEYMLGRGMSTMQDEGQYFTNRIICNLAFTLAYRIKKTLRREDGSLCTFADWFCGTGGFPTAYIKGVNENLADIDWSSESGAIYCQDMNISSVTNTLLNLLILTGVPFSGETIRSCNSFSDPIISGPTAPFHGVSIDYNFMNPPYGGDKSKGKEYKFAYTKGKGTAKKYMVNDDIKSIGIEDDDKVSAGVQLAMATLSSDGGVCCIVLPQGFFSGVSNKCIELKKKIVEEYRIHYIVDIASGSFLNTGTKTSMMVFQKGVGPTETITFMRLDEKMLVEVTLDELRAKNYLLNYTQYLPQSVVEVDGFEMVKLGDLVHFSGGKFTTGYSKENPGMYPFFSGKTLQPDGTCKDFCFDGDEYLVLIKDGGSGVGIYGDKIGMGKIFYVKGKSAGTSHNAALHKKSEKVLLMYLYYYLKSIKSSIMDLAKYTTGLGVISQGDLRELQIPLPSLEKQQEIVDSIDSFTQLAHAEEQSLKMLEKSVMFEMKWMGMGKERVKLGDVCEFQRGKMITKMELIDGDFPVIGGGLSPMGFHTQFNRDAYTPLISQSGENAGHISRYTKAVWASDCFSVSSSKINSDYVYYSLLQIQENINFLKTGTAQPHIYPSSISHLEIPLPSLAEQQTLQSDFDEIRHKHAKIAEYKAKAQAAIQRLIPNITPVVENTENIVVYPTKEDVVKDVPIIDLPDLKKKVTPARAPIKK